MGTEVEQRHRNYLAISHTLRKSDRPHFVHAFLANNLTFWSMRQKATSFDFNVDNFERIPRRMLFSFRRNREVGEITPRIWPSLGIEGHMSVRPTPWQFYLSIECLLCILDFVLVLLKVWLLVRYFTPYCSQLEMNWDASDRGWLMQLLILDVIRYKTYLT